MLKRKRERIRALRKTFSVLRSAGLLFLEDMDTDRHLLVSFELALKPAILHALAGSYAMCLASWMSQTYEVAAVF